MYLHGKKKKSLLGKWKAKGRSERAGRKRMGMWRGDEGEEQSRRLPGGGGGY